MVQVAAKLKSYISDTKGQQWIEDLILGDDDCKRLAYCLAIELKIPKHEILFLAHVDKLFHNCDYDHDIFATDNTYPRKWFHKKLDSVKAAIKNATGCIVPTTESIEATGNPHRYSTFMTFYRLKKYYLDELGFRPRSYSYNNPDEVIEFIESRPDMFDEIASMFGGLKAPVWVTTRQEADHIKDNIDTYDKATNIMNCLGLHPDDEGLTTYPHTGDMFFQIDYPEPCNLTTWQPSSLNKNWTDANKDLYLSFIKKDKFGKTYTRDSTCSCSSREQIHEGFACKDRGLKISYN